MRWPTPERLQLHGIDIIGYENGVLFPVEIVPVNPERPVRAHATVFYSACSEICIPIDAELTLDLTTGASVPTKHADTIERALTRVPRQDGDDISIAGVVSGGDEAAPQLRVTIRSTTGEPIVEPDMLIEYSDDVRFSRPELHLSADRREATLTVGVQNFLGEPASAQLAGETVTITVVDGERAVEAERLIE